MNTNKRKWSFETLVGSIRQVHEELAAQAGRAVNLSLTLRNWLIGCYIAEYEQRGADRAEYGKRLLESLSTRLIESGLEGVASRSLRQYRQFYLIYPAIWQILSTKSFDPMIPAAIRQTLPAKSSTTLCQSTHPAIPAPDLLRKLSFSHFAELIAIPDGTKRRFFEIECIRGNWSVRELKLEQFSHQKHRPA